MIDLHSIMGTGEYHIHIRNVDELEELKEAWHSISRDAMTAEFLTRHAGNASLVLQLDFEYGAGPCWYWYHTGSITDGTIIHTIDDIRPQITADLGSIETDGIDLFALFGGDKPSV